MLPAGADQQVDALLSQVLRNEADIVGEVVRLDVAGSAASALYLATEADQRNGGVILVHDLHGNADAPGIIRQMRVKLTDADWDTLAPVLPTGFKNETIEAWVARHASLAATVAAAVSWLSARDVDNIALIGVAGGGSVVLATLAARNPPEIAGIVLISSALDETEQQMLAELELPTLDVHAEFDFANVKQGIAARRESLADLPSYVQREIAGASAGFYGVEGTVISTVRAWLNGVMKPGHP